MPRFVILWHELPPDHPRPSHWDLMLEDGPILRSWALDQQPTLDRSTLAERLPDHRLAYLDYEGPVSAGRGTVTRWDGGDFEWLLQDINRFVARLHGQKFRAKIRLTRDSITQRWLLEAADEVDSAKRD